MTVKPMAKDFDCVVDDRGSKQYLKIDMRPRAVSIFVFPPSGGYGVRATENGGDLTFLTGEGISFRWIADLKDANAQRVANQFSAILARVGLDESEWTRTS